MKKIIHLAAILFCCLTINSCTNDEDDEKIDVLTPTDSAKSEQIIQGSAV